MPRAPVASLLIAFLFASSALAQDAKDQSQTQPTENRVGHVLTFFGGAALGLAAHEGGHLLFDAVFDAKPTVKRVSFVGIPFFAISHPPSLPPREEFVIASAGFWMQHASSELLLSRRPYLRDEAAPLAKGWLAFNVLVSVAYAGAAFARAGPHQRDTRSMAEQLRVGEPWVGALVLTPAALDSYRYFQPNARWARWTSRATKVGLVVLLVRAAR